MRAKLIAAHTSGFAAGLPAVRLFHEPFPECSPDDAAKAIQAAVACAEDAVGQRPHMVVTGAGFGILEHVSDTWRHSHDVVAELKHMERTVQSMEAAAVQFGKDLSRALGKNHPSCFVGVDCTVISEEERQPVEQAGQMIVSLADAASPPCVTWKVLPTRAEAEYMLFPWDYSNLFDQKPEEAALQSHIVSCNDQSVLALVCFEAQAFTRDFTGDEGRQNETVEKLKHLLVESQCTCAVNCIHALPWSAKTSSLPSVFTECIDTLAHQGVPVVSCSGVPLAGHVSVADVAQWLRCDLPHVDVAIEW